MILTSRKRKTSGDSNNPNSSPNLSNDPFKKFRTTNQPSNPQELRNFVLPNNSVLIKQSLQVMEKDQLIDFILNIMNQNPLISHVINDSLPKPTLAQVQQILERKLQQLYSHIPYTKEKTHNDYSFNRIKPLLNNLKETSIFYLEYFSSKSSYSVLSIHEFPDNTFGYLDFSTHLIHRLPTWTSQEKNNETKNTFYSILSESWRRIIVDVAGFYAIEGRCPPISSVKQWRSCLVSHHSALEGAFGFDLCIAEFESQFGWMN